MSEYDDKVEEALEELVGATGERGWLAALKAATRTISKHRAEEAEEYQWGTLAFDDGWRFLPPEPGWTLHSWQWPEGCRDVVVVWSRKVKP
jgi:hypothetical protein